MNVPTMIVGIINVHIPIYSGDIMPIPIVMTMDDKIANNTAIPVMIIVYELKSMDFISFISLIITPRTILWIFQAIRR